MPRGTSWRNEISEKIYATYYIIPLYYQENVFGFTRRIKTGNPGG